MLNKSLRLSKVCLLTNKHRDLGKGVHFMSFKHLHISYNSHILHGDITKLINIINVSC